LEEEYRELSNLIRSMREAGFKPNYEQEEELKIFRGDQPATETNSSKDYIKDSELSSEPSQSSYFYNENGTLRTVYKVLIGVTVILIISGVVYYYYPFSGSGSGSGSSGSGGSGGSDYNSMTDPSTKPTSSKSSLPPVSELSEGSVSDASTETVKPGYTRRKVNPVAPTTGEASTSSYSPLLRREGKTSMRVMESLKIETLEVSEKMVEFKSQLVELTNSLLKSTGGAGRS